MGGFVPVAHASRAEMRPPQHEETWLQQRYLTLRCPLLRASKGEPQGKFQ